MKFETELDLVSTLVDFVKYHYKSRNNIEVYEEVSLGFGIADVVITNMLSYNLDKSINTKLNIHDINLYDLIRKHREGIDMNVIIEILRGNKKAIANSLHKLLSSNYIIETDNIYFTNTEYIFPFRNNFAIEAKLRDWRKALKQAYRYKWFAEYSFVVIDEYYSKTALANIEEFKKYNVGLATISKENGLIRHHYPIPETPYDLKMKMLFSEMILENHTFAK